MPNAPDSDTANYNPALPTAFHPFSPLSLPSNAAPLHASASLAQRTGTGTTYNVLKQARLAPNTCNKQAKAQVRKIRTLICYFSSNILYKSRNIYFHSFVKRFETRSQQPVSLGWHQYTEALLQPTAPARPWPGHAAYRTNAEKIIMAPAQ